MSAFTPPLSPACTTGAGSFINSKVSSQSPGDGWFPSAMSLAMASIVVTRSPSPNGLGTGDPTGLPSWSSSGSSINDARTSSVVMRSREGTEESRSSNPSLFISTDILRSISSARRSPSTLGRPDALTLVPCSSFSRRATALWSRERTTRFIDRFVSSVSGWFDVSRLTGSGRQTLPPSAGSAFGRTTGTFLAIPPPDSLRRRLGFWTLAAAPGAAVLPATSDIRGLLSSYGIDLDLGIVSS
mmetsp:Transcript_1959/g.4282  ORF Transcript_1959/g.4282 Transcript_1959/m.4282 type:complete len:242 (-) Transcript_1959:2100-2825(-)